MYVYAPRPVAPPRPRAPDPTAPRPVTSYWHWHHRGRPSHILEFTCINNDAGFIRSAVNYHGRIHVTNWDGFCRFYTQTDGVCVAKISFRYFSPAPILVTRLLEFVQATAEGPMYCDGPCVMVRMSPAGAIWLRHWMIMRVPQVEDEHEWERLIETEGEHDEDLGTDLVLLPGESGASSSTQGN